MSLVQFTEMYEICCGMTEEPELVFKRTPAFERLEIRNDEILESNRWFYAAKDILNEEERELFYV